MQTKEIAIEYIQLDEKVKSIRDNQNEEAIGRYMEKYESGTSKPILVKEIDRQNFILIDGHHRLEAVKRLERRKIDAEIIDIPDKEIYSKAVECNQEHGVRLTNEEEKLTMINFIEEGKSHDDMAKIFHVGRTAITMRINRDPILKKLQSDKICIPTINYLLEGKKQEEVACILKDSLGKGTQQRVSQIWNNWLDDIKELFNSGFSREEIINIQNEKNIKLTSEHLKDLIEGNYNEIRGGDCLEKIKEIPDNSINCLIIDPPYGIDFQSQYKKEKFEKLEGDDKEAFNLLDKSLKLVQPKLKKDSHIYIFSSWKVWDKVKPIVERYFDLRNCLVWNKKQFGMGDLNGNYAETYELIIFASQGKRKLLSDKRPLNILEFSPTSNLNHPTEKPVELIKELIRNSTLEGEIVLDYFAGSGSTLLASKELKRKWIGIEKDKNYVELIKSRLNKDVKN